MRTRTASTAPGWTALALLLLFGCGGDDDPTDPGDSGDTTPPAAVVDLTVTSVAGSVVNLAWTAPGDDGAEGLATAYDLRVSAATLTEANWDSATRIVMGVPSPAAAGVAQTASIDAADKSDRYLAIRALDEADNMGALSNVVAASVDDAGFTVRQLSSVGPCWHPCVHDGVVCWAGWTEEGEDIFVANVREAFPSPTRLTENGGEKEYPSNHGSSKIVWQWRESPGQDWEIVVYDQNAVPRYQPLTDNEVHDVRPVLAGGGDFAWLSGNTMYEEVRYWDEFTHSASIISDDCCPTTRYTNDFPAADDGEVVWISHDRVGSDPSRILHWDGVLTDITNVLGGGGRFSIHDGELAYESGLDPTRIAYWDGVEIHTVGDGREPSLYDGAIAWEDWDGLDWEVYYWDGADVHQITDNDYNDTQVSLHDGIIAWTGRPAGVADQIFYAIVEDE